MIKLQRPCRFQDPTRHWITSFPMVAILYDCSTRAAVWKGLTPLRRTAAVAPLVFRPLARANLLAGPLEHGPGLRHGGDGPVKVEVEFGGIGGPFATAVKLGALFDGKRHVMNVALHARGGLQGHRHAADHAGNRAADDDAFGGDRTRHPALLADDHLGATHVTFDLTIHLQGPLADDL